MELHLHDTDVKSSLSDLTVVYTCGAVDNNMSHQVALGWIWKMQLQNAAMSRGTLESKGKSAKGMKSAETKRHLTPAWMLSFGRRMPSLIFLQYYLLLNENPRRG